MTSQKEQAILDLRFIVNDSPTVFTFATRYYNATRAGLSRSEKNELGGFEIDIDLSLVIQLYADFTSVNVTPPAVGSNVIVEGVTYEVARIQDDEFGVARRLDLKSLAR